MAENDQAPVEIPAITEADLPKGNPANVDRYNAVVEATPVAEQDTATIEKARADGWAPKDHWRGDPAEWVDAAEFNARGPIMKKMNAQSSALAKANAKMAKLEAAMEAMAETNQTIMNKDTEEVLGTLKQERADAISVGNGERVNELDDEIEKFKNTVVNDKPGEREAGVADVAAVTYPDEFYQFEEQNTWYATQERVDAGAPVDWEMTQITDTLAQSFYRGQQAQGLPEPTPADALAYVQTKLQVMYPDKFNSEAPAPIPNQGNVRQPPPSIVEPNGEISANQRNLQNAPKVHIDSLPFEEQKMIRKMAEGSNQPVQDYLDQMQERG